MFIELLDEISEITDTYINKNIKGIKLKTKTVENSIKDEKYLRQGERLDDLEIQGLKIIQKTDEYCFSSDSVLLANSVSRSCGKVCELCSGSGVIATIIAGKKNPKHITCIEIQEAAAERATRSVQLNNLQDKIETICVDLKDSPMLLGKESFDSVVCNPPYFKAGSGETKLTKEQAISRHEIMTNLNEICLTASKLLKFGGKFYIIHKTTRLAEVIATLAGCGLEPKVLTLVEPKAKKQADVFIIESKKGAATGLKLKHLVVYEENGEMTTEAKVIYCKT